jgi:uncharacterized membrane protein HdeD (DUF308 family)
MKRMLTVRWLVIGVYALVWGVIMIMNAVQTHTWPTDGQWGALGAGVAVLYALLKPDATPPPPPPKPEDGS